mgnify:CR=1 FL=1
MQKLKKIFSRQNGLVLLLVLVEFMVLALRFVGDFRTGGVIDITPDLIIPYAEECTNDDRGARVENFTGLFATTRWIDLPRGSYQVCINYVNDGEDGEVSFLDEIMPTAQYDAAKLPAERTRTVFSLWMPYGCETAQLQFTADCGKNQVIYITGAQIVPTHAWAYVRLLTGLVFCAVLDWVILLLTRRVKFPIHTLRGRYIAMALVGIGVFACLPLGLGYLTLDRASSTLSTGERQRMQLARAVRNRTTGVLYVLDEPSIGLHPSNIVGLNGVMHDLIADGNSVVLVDHDTQVLAESDWLIEMGPEAGAGGGHVIAEGTVADLAGNPASQIGPFLGGQGSAAPRNRPAAELFAEGRIHLSTDAIHTVKPLEVDIPKGRLTVVTGVSGSGKTTLILESLVPALAAQTAGKPLPPHVRAVEADGIAQVKLIDATPIGINVRSTVATYANVHDELRKVFARTPDAKRLGYKAGDFSYNTGKLRCPVCDGTGVIGLDVQFLPDVEITCPKCGGSRYSDEARRIRCRTAAGEKSLPDLMSMDVDQALAACAGMKAVPQKLKVLHDLGLGYLTLGEETPSLSGGEAQRLKLASEMGKSQSSSVFVFDEPTIGLHPLDVRTLLQVFDRLIAQGATVIVIEHDLDVIANADYIIDMGPGGGEDGGKIVVSGTPEAIRACPQSQTGKFL